MVNTLRCLFLAIDCMIMVKFACMLWSDAVKMMLVSRACMVIMQMMVVTMMMLMSMINYINDDDNCDHDDNVNDHDQ